jgi:hypothetical protein
VVIASKVLAISRILYLNALKDSRLVSIEIIYLIFFLRWPLGHKFLVAAYSSLIGLFTPIILSVYSLLYRLIVIRLKNEAAAEVV